MRLWKWFTFRGEGLFTPAHAFITLVLAVFFFFVVRGCHRQDETRSALVENCEPTNFYATEARGKTIRVYSCPDGFELP